MHSLSPELPTQITSHFAMLNARLAAVPELSPAFALIEAEPANAVETYLGYAGLVCAMTELSPAEQETIAEAHDWLQVAGGVGGSASSVSATDMYNSLQSTGNREVFQGLVGQSVNPGSAYYQPAVNELVARLEGGHQLKASGKTPSDFDAASRRVIWGHTVITEPRALMHFLNCHYLERFMASALGDKGIAIAAQKDFLVNALTDMVILTHQESAFAAQAYTLWATPKNQGGMGWITADRLHSWDITRRVK